MPRRTAYRVKGVRQTFIFTSPTAREPYRRLKAGQYESELTFGRDRTVR
jgi:hypothetical protein